jgi:excisionase family DNA binding protein
MKHTNDTKTGRAVLTMTEVADELRIGRVTAWRLVSTGQIKGFRAGKGWRVRSADLVEFMEKGPIDAHFIEGKPSKNKSH